MRVETGRNDDQLRCEALDRRQDNAGVGLVELDATGARRQWRIEDVADAALGGGPGSRIERHLMGRGIEDGRVGPDTGLRAIAVMHVEVDDGDATRAVRTLRMAGGDD